MSEAKFTIYFYKTISGRQIIEQFIDSLDEITGARVRNSINLLKQYGLELITGPWVKKINKQSSIYELRITGKKQVRLLFFQYNKNIFVIVNIFIKKQQKTPKKELDLAVKRVKEFL